tara:strand:- start:3743 stop:4384 length:642 start_codon:yes stop_codon:yes gene_type:complete
VLLSGGLDSTACLIGALERWESVDAIGFDYGQPHRSELAAARKIAGALGVPFQVAFLELSGGLLDGGVEGGAAVVPGRNEAFLRAAKAASPRCGGLVVGSTAEDQEVFADCRPEFFDRMRDDLDFPIWTPLIELRKSDVWSMVPQEIRRQTRSCYRSTEVACGSCGACQVRALAVPCPACRIAPGEQTPPGVRCHSSSGFGLPHRKRVEASCQ